MKLKLVYGNYKLEISSEDLSIQCMVQCIETRVENEKVLHIACIIQLLFPCMLFTPPLPSNPIYMYSTINFLIMFILTSFIAFVQKQIIHPVHTLYMYTNNTTCTCTCMLLTQY